MSASSAVPARKRVRHNVFVDSPRRSLAAQSGAKFFRIGSPEQVRPSVWDSPFRSSLMSNIPIDAVPPLVAMVPGWWALGLLGRRLPRCLGGDPVHPRGYGGSVVRLQPPVVTPVCDRIEG